MIIWNRLSLAWAAFLHGAEDEDKKLAVLPVAAAMAKRWSAAAANDPELAADLIRISGLLTTSPVDRDPETGLAVPRDPYQEFEQKGARDLALKLLAAMHITPEEINVLMETSE